MAKTPDAQLAPRVPPLLMPNAWSRRLAERRATGAGVLDLIELNPTRLGWIDDAAVADVWRRALADPRAARYEPDPEGLLEAREAVAAYYRARGTPVEPGQ